MNNYEFWDNYLNDIKDRLNKLLEEKDTFNIDLHMHSYKSTDSDYTLENILKCTKNLDVISITDHDSLEIYDELYNYLSKNKIDKPIIIPGIEFTTLNNEYGSQCHILEYFINPKDEEVISDVRLNREASYYRTKEQFRRLKNNKGFMEYVYKYDIYISYDEYVDNLKELPDYRSLSEYLMNKLKEYNITAMDVLEKCKYYNKFDKCIDRKEKTLNRFNYLEEKHKDKDNSNNARLLLSTLGPRGVDDDYYKDYESTGSISVNSYNQIRIEDINKKYPLVFAHPNSDKMDIVEKIIINNKNFKGIENNISNKNEDINKINELNKKYNLALTKGTDTHKEYLYDNNLLEVTKEELKKIINM